MNERQELYCHECGRYVQFDVDVELDGKHVLTCPVCRHEHCRVVRNGQVTDERWDSRNGPVNIYYVTGSITTTTASVFTFDDTFDMSSGELFLKDSWFNATSSQLATVIFT